MNRIPRVLVISRDGVLLQTRQLILGAFFEVDGAGRIKEAETLLDEKTFDLIVICYSLSDAECQRIIELSRQKDPPAKILALTPAGRLEARPAFQGAIMTEAGPYYLLKRSAELLGVELKLRGRSAAA